jgi:hypothetical protein
MGTAGADLIDAIEIGLSITVVVAKRKLPAVV